MIKIRLLKVAELLEKQAEKEAKNPDIKKRFCLSSWDCGTAACAVGLAARNKWFNARGLKMNKGVPAFKEHRNWRAVSEFFKIYISDAEELFSMYSYLEEGHTTALEVAARIREFVEKGEVK